MENFENQPRPAEQPDVEPAASLPFATEFAAVQPAVQQLPKKRKKRGTWKTVLSAVLIVSLVICACGITAASMNAYWQDQLNKTTAALNKTVEDLRRQLGSGSQTTVVLPNGEDLEGELSPAQVYALNVEAVVAISSQGQTTNIFGQTSETASAGSGFIVSEDGYVVTNYHVISGGSRVGVILPDGREYDASLVGSDETNDITVLKIEGRSFPYVSLGSSDAMVVGDRVAAIGNPLGELSSTLTVGYISAKDRTVNTDGTYQNMIQTDAAINSGNSGGPLFNMRGEVIGITTAKYTGTSSSGATIEGIGFAIPMDDVRDIIDDLCEFGHIKSGYLGIMAQDVAAETAEQYGLPLGALVVEVEADSCAERGGIKAKDIIVDLNGQTIGSMSELSRALSRYEGGEEITVTVYRSGGETVLNVTLDEKPVEQTQAPAQQEQQSQGGSYFPDWFNPFG